MAKKEGGVLKEKKNKESTKGSLKLLWLNFRGAIHRLHLPTNWVESIVMEMSLVFCIYQLGLDQHSRRLVLCCASTSRCTTMHQLEHQNTMCESIIHVWYIRYPWYPRLSSVHLLLVTEFGHFHSILDAWWVSLLTIVKTKSRICHKIG
jgi:hypothetical protein